MAATKEIKYVYKGTTKVRPPEIEECVIYKILAVDGGRIYVATNGANYSGSRNAPYSWYISVDGGAETLYSGTGGSNIVLTGYTNNQIYTVKIRPSVVDYGWARACGWWNSGVQDTVLMEIVYDGSYIGYASSATNTGNYFRAYQYIKCTLLKNAPEEYLPDTVTTIGNYFRYAQYQQCTALPSSPEESMPSSITTIGTDFRSNQYYYCSNLRNINGWKDLSIGNSNYRYHQYYTTSYKAQARIISNVGYGSSGSEDLVDARTANVRVPSEYISNFVNATTNPRSGISDLKFIGYIGRPGES